MREFSAISDHRSAGETNADPSRKMSFAAELLCHSSSGDFNRLEYFAPNCELSTVDCKPAFLTPRLLQHQLPLLARRHFRSCALGKETPRTGLKTGHYIGKNAARHPPVAGKQKAGPTRTVDCRL